MLRKNRNAEIDNYVTNIMYMCKYMVYLRMTYDVYIFFYRDEI